MDTNRGTRAAKRNAACALWVCILGPGIAAAALGETEASVGADAAHLRGSEKVVAHSGYRVHEIALPSGTRVREFVGPDGRVFAVAWAGPTVPNLRATLGQYLDDYAAAAKAAHRDHHHLAIHKNDLVVESGGHPRAFAGRAYLASAIPAGVDPEELR